MYNNIYLWLCTLVYVMCLKYTYVSSSVVPIEKEYRLDIVHYNDFHDRFEETTVLYPVCSTNDTQCIGGFSRLYHEVMELMREKPDALLLNAGDTFQGTYWYTLLKWNVTQKFINLLPNDAHAIGNHEFDDGVAGLAPYLKALKAPVVAANLDVSKESSLKELIQPSTIVTRKGRMIGIIGLITPLTAKSSSSGDVIFLDPVSSAKTEAEKLAKEGIDIIILLSHCGFSVDEEIAKVAGENIDIIVGGHSHTLLWNGTAPSNETVLGPYPVLVNSEKRPAHQVLIVTASAFSKYLGNLTVYFDGEGELQRYEGTPVFLNRSIPEDPEIKAMMQPYVDKLHSLVEEVIGQSDDNMLLSLCASEECSLGNLVADSFNDAAKDRNISSLPHVAIVLRNNIRGSIPKGVITIGTVINALPFTNTVVSCVIKGKYIKEALAYSISEFWVKQPFAGPMLAHVSGMRVVLNAKERTVDSVMLKKGDDYLPLDPEEDVQLTVLNFLIRKGNGLQIYENGRNFTKIDLEREALIKYVKKITPVVPVLDNRLTVIN